MALPIFSPGILTDHLRHSLEHMYAILETPLDDLPSPLSWKSSPFHSAAQQTLTKQLLSARTVLGMRPSVTWFLPSGSWQYRSHQARYWLFFPVDRDSGHGQACSEGPLVPWSRLPASLPKVLRPLFPSHWVGEKVSDRLLPKLPTFLCLPLVESPSSPRVKSSFLSWT